MTLELFIDMPGKRGVGMQCRSIGKALYFAPVVLMLGCAAPISTAAVSAPDYQSQINDLRHTINKLQYKISELQDINDKSPETMQSGDSKEIRDKIEILNNTIADIKNQLSGLAGRVEQIAQKTDNICFQYQSGLTVMRPCR